MTAEAEDKFESFKNLDLDKLVSRLNNYPFPRSSTYHYRTESLKQTMGRPLYRRYCTHMAGSCANHHIISNSRRTARPAATRRLESIPIIATISWCNTSLWPTLKDTM